MKKVKLAFVVFMLLLQTGCLTTRITPEEQKKYETVLVMSTLGSKFTVNHAKNYLLAIKNEIYTEKLAGGGFIKDFEDFIVSELEGQVPFELTTLHDLYSKDKVGALEIYNVVAKSRNPKKILASNGFDGLLLLQGQTIVYGHPQGGIDLVYDELGIYRQGKKTFAFSHFAFSFLDVFSGRKKFLESCLETTQIRTTSFRWPTAGRPIDPDVSTTLKGLAKRLTEKRVSDTLEDRFFLAE